MEKINFRFWKKEKKGILYNGYIQKKKKEEDLKERICEDPEKITKVKINKTVLIGVCNLKGSIGSSYLSKALKRYIETVLKKKTGIFDLQIQNDFIDYYDEYDFIILDGGNMEKLQPEQKRELKRTDIKLILSLLDNEYLLKLAEFIREESGQWKYIFNHVPKNKNGVIEDLMEGYEYYYFSTFDTEKLGKEEKNIIKQILGG